MDPLIEGYRRFRAEVWPAERARYEALANWGQNPEAMVVACSDSRVDPQTVFGAAPGELFVVRNVAALVPVYSPDPGHHGTSAALEFGVRVLKVPRLVVLGHGQCGVRSDGLGRRLRPQTSSPPGSRSANCGSGCWRPPGRLERIEAEVVRLSSRQSHDLPVDRGRSVQVGSFCRAFCSTSTRGCLRALAGTARAGS
jgi:carbonic anhydrase